MTMLIRVTHAHRSGIPRDNVVHDFAFKGDPTDGAVRTQVFDGVEAFYRNTYGAASFAKVSNLLSNELLRSGGGSRMDCFDISAHEDGSPHGSPLSSRSFDMYPAGGSDGLPSQIALVLSFRGNNANLAEEGSVQELPTPRSAIRMGAPETHTGRSRPRSRLRGRIYIGPLWVGVSVPGTNGHAVPASGAIACLTGAAVALANLAVDGVTPERAWSVWSRRAADLNPIIAGFVDDSFDTQRRRTLKASSRTVWAA